MHCTGPDRTPLFRVPPPSSCPWAKRHGCLRAIAVHSRSGIQQFTPAVVPEDGLSSTSTAYPWRGAGSGPRPNPVTLCLGGSLGRLRRVVTPLTGCCRLCLRAGRGDPGLGWLFPRQPSWFQLRRMWRAGRQVVPSGFSLPLAVGPPARSWTVGGEAPTPMRLPLRRRQLRHWAGPTCTYAVVPCRGGLGGWGPL